MTTRRFTQHYTVAEARAVLPQVRGWLMELRQLGPALYRVLAGTRVDNVAVDLPEYRRLRQRRTPPAMAAAVITAASIATTDTAATVTHRGQPCWQAWLRARPWRRPPWF
jgi:hypothetical protein